MMESAKTPLLDLLKSIPADGQGLYEVSPIEHRNIPYGRLCKEAVDEIEQLRAENEALRKDVEQWKKRFYARLTDDNNNLWKKFSDTDRLNWLESNPRHAQIVVDGKMTDCVFYGISCANLVKLRDAIDAAMKEEEE